VLESRPETSVTAVMNIISEYGNLSGYKINMDKSMALDLNIPATINLETISPV
jgi:hypothetical protein